MKRLSAATALTLATTLVGLSLQIVPQQQSGETIAGTVTRADTKQPLPYTRVELVSEDYVRLPTGHEKVCKSEREDENTDQRRLVTTDSNGKFAFTDVGPGRYYLSAEHEGYLHAAYGQRGRYPLGSVLRIGASEGDFVAAEGQPPRAVPDDTRIVPLPDLNALVPPLGGLGRDQQGLLGGASSAIRDGNIAQTGQRGGLGRTPERIPGGAGAPSAILDNATNLPKIQLQNLELVMTPAPTITGMVVDDRGAPQAAASVQAYEFRYTPMNGRTLKSTRATLTEDTGQYRLFWLNPGRYVIAASHSRYGLLPWTSGLDFTPNLPSSDAGQPAVFYPASPIAGNAIPVPLNPGEEPRVDLKLQDRARFNVRVRLVGDRLPSTPTLVFVPYGGDLCAGLDYGISASASGTFEVRDVPEGLYVAMAMSGRDVVSELITVKVERQSTEEIRLPVVPSTEVRGNIVFDPMPPGMDPGALRVTLVRSGQEVRQLVTTVVDPETGRFSLSGIGPGSYYPVVDLPPGAYVRDVTASKFQPMKPDDCDPELQSAPNYSYQDLHGHFDPQKPLRIPTVIPNAAQCLNLRISVGHPLRGYVLDRSQKPIAGALVVAIPKSVWAKEQDQGATPPDRYLIATTDDTGYFQLQGAADQMLARPGEPPAPEYHLFAFEDIDPNAIYDPGFSDRFRGRETFERRELHFSDGKWMTTSIVLTTVATWGTCGAIDSPSIGFRCYLTPIPAEETAEIR